MYEGVPPLTGAGVNVTLEPLHTGGTGLAVILTEGIMAVLMLTTTVLDVAVAGVAHVAFDNITQ